jgi:GT2 family glycosyltransferase
MEVTIIVPTYKPDERVLKDLIRAVNKQKFSGEKRLMILRRAEGLAKQVNWGVLHSKGEVVIMLPQDCIPQGSRWLEQLTKSFKDPKVVASVSKVTFPEQLWEKSSTFTKALILKERGTLTSALDGKGSAYRRSSLKKVGLFDDTTFRTAGEDFDIFLKLKKIGKITYPDAEIIHFHPTTAQQRLRKIRQYANGYGALVRLYGAEMPRWYGGFIFALPVIGLLGIILNYPYTRGVRYLLPYLILSPLIHIQYIRGFWKGLLEGRQTV